jgi:cobalt/nickel transport system ATP-binding protein
MTGAILADVILAARGLDYDYPGGIPALRGVDLAIRRGRRLAILGPNGSGKTTLFLHLNGTLKPRTGAILIDGCPGHYDRRTLRAWRSRVGLVLQDPDDQLFAATVAQDIAFGPLNLRLPQDTVRDRVATALAALDITALAHRPTHMLSIGQKRRVAIAGILAMEPEILLLDEPTAGLDADGVARLMSALNALAERGTTLVLSTHDVDLAYGWADEIAIFAGGSVIGQGDPSALLGDPAMLARGGLRMPLVLETARTLIAVGHIRPNGPLPRTRAELMKMIAKR